MAFSLRKLFNKTILGPLLILITLTSCSSSYVLPDCSSSIAVDTSKSKYESIPEPSTLTANYRWQNINISGMGCVTGLVIHPTEPNLIYARTDVGGIYRWNATSSSWIQLMDGLSDHYSIESIALDPNNSQILYTATGEGEVLKSVDRGNTWTSATLKTQSGETVRMDGNAEWRWAGERLVVDPDNSQIVYFGSRWDGLYRSNDGATTWSQVTSFPTKGINGGIAFVVFGRSITDAHNSFEEIQVIYAGVMGSGVYRSVDAGRSWVLLTGGPDPQQNPQRAVVASDGTLYVTFFTTPSKPQGSVWKYQADQWTEITPAGGVNYSAIASNPQSPGTVLVATYPFSPQGLYRTTDAGIHWQSIELDVNAVQWWPKWHLYTLTGGVAINPNQPEQVWLTTGFGVMRTDKITDRPSKWCTYMNNLEELVVFVVKSPPVSGGAMLLSGVADMDGFRHDSFSQIPQTTYDNGKFGDTTGIDFSEANPNIVVRVGSSPGAGGREDSQGRSAYSSDNGRTWKNFENTPVGAANGKVAVSATLQPNGHPIIVWAPQGNVYPHRSLDGGKTWQPVQGAPNQTTAQLWFPSQAIASDRVDGNFFYLYKYNENSNQGEFYRSTDGSATWQKILAGLPNHYLHSVKAVPGMRGEVWLSVHGNHLYRSSNAGSTFTPVAQIQKANEVAFGKAAPGYATPTVFVYGTIDGIEGLFRSDNATSLPGDVAKARWIKISTDQQRLGSTTFLEGDRLRFGRVYVGTGGRGILYGEPQVEADIK